MELIHTFDNMIFEFFSSLSCSVLNVIFGIFTYCGEAGAIWIAIGFLLVIPRKTRKIGCYLFVCLALTYLLNDVIIKNIAQRPRPFIADSTIELAIKAPSGYSFPSGHSASSMAAATAIFLFDRKKGALAYVLAFLIAVSRIYFFVHYPTDVLCGIIVGIVCANIIVRLGTRLEDKVLESFR